MSARVSSTKVSPLYWFCSSEKATSSAALVLGDIVVLFGGAPCNGAKDPAVLFERHLEVALLQFSRPVHDLDPARGKDRSRITGAERRQRRDTGGDAAGDPAERQVARRSAAVA